MTQQTPSVPQVPVRYRLVSCLGKGGMGSVWLAEDRALERQVAIKVPHLGEDVSPEVVRRFQIEARAAARVTHDNLCPIFDVGEHGGLPFLVMPFIEGKPLSKYCGRPWPPERAVRLVAVLARALAVVHAAGLVHRDLKPANVMMRADGRPVLMDFGLASSGESQSKRLTREGAVLGTPAYMAPEQAEGRLRDMGPATDVYGLGVILFELLTARTPFEGPPMAVFGQILHVQPPTPSDLCAGIAPALDAICLKALAKKPAERFASMAEFVVSLEACERQRPPVQPTEAVTLHTETIDIPDRAPLPETYPTSSARTLLPPPGRRSRWLVAAGVLLVMALLPLVWLLSGGGQPEQTRPPAGELPKEVTVDLGKEVKLGLVRIDPGEFQMGAPDGEAEAQNDEKPQHTVRITRPFYLGKYEVTQAQYQRLAPQRSQPCWFSAEGGGKDKVQRMDTNRFPAECVSWNEATTVCERLNQDYLSGLPEALRKAGYRFKLPTEAQWEYACRAGTTTPFHFGKELNGTQANCNGDFPYGTQEKGKNWERTTPVGSYPKNAWGLYDMHGNVWEWCEDSQEAGRYKNRAGQAKIEDPKYPEKAAEDQRVRRGGAWGHYARFCRAAYRSEDEPANHDINYGFRLALRQD
jgi:formylglycine-generating enzyme required for sulfatase activity/predicted Ser/Thr protein kinase